MTSRPASADGGTRPMLGAPLPKGMLSPGSARQLAAIPDPKSSAHQDAAFATSSTALLPRAVSGGASIARLPDWATDRPYSGSTHLINTLQNRDRVPKGTVSRKQGLNTYPVPMQEQLIADDLLHVLLGITGKYIAATIDPSGDIVWVIDKNLDVSLADLVHRVLPMGTYYLNISQFIAQRSNFHFGLVNHALCAAIRTMLKEYLILVAQLENQSMLGQLSLQKFWFYVQPSVRTLQVLDKLVRTISQVPNSKGSALLNIVHQQAAALGGDARLKEMFEYLLAKAAAPILNMTAQWLYRGLIDDTYNEFLVHQHENVSKETLSQYYEEHYWERHYTIRQQQVPFFVSKLASQVLTTGKYLDVIRECSHKLVCPFEEKFEYAANERVYQPKVERAYNFAARALLDLLMNERKLLQRLASIKHYFLCDQGDYLVYFMDIAADELDKPVGKVNASKLSSLLELSLRTTIAANDEFHEEISCGLLPHSLINQLLSIIAVDGKTREPPAESAASTLKTSGWEAFSLEYKADFPLSIILSRKAITKYQLLFRFLLHAKHVERQLCNVWLNHQTTKNYEARLAFSLSYALRHRMLHFLQNLAYYMMAEVIEPNWAVLMDKLKVVSTIDELLDQHMDFLDSCLKECMLTDPLLLKTITKLMSTCLIFASHTERFTKTLVLDDEVLEGNIERSHERPRFDGRKVAAAAERTAAQQFLDQRARKMAKEQVASAHVRKIVHDTSYQKTIRTFEENFNANLRTLLAALHSHPDSHMTRLSARLNHNSYYTAYFQADWFS